MEKLKVKFKKMTKKSFENYMNFSIKNYAEEKIKSGNWSEEEAEENSKKTFEQLLPQKEKTPDNYFYEIHSQEDIHIGNIWFFKRNEEIFLADIYIDEEFQGKGYGKDTMKELETKARKLKAKTIALHVFGHNKKAFKLYESFGFYITNINMTKDLK